MRRGSWLTRPVRRWLEAREGELTLRRCGGDQRCPWCREWVNRHEDTSNRDFEGGFLTEIACGNCGGTSIWKWEVGFIYVTTGDRPPSAERASDFGDSPFIRGEVAKARVVIERRQAALAAPPASPSERSARPSGNQISE